MDSLKKAGRLLRRGVRHCAPFFVATLGQGLISLILCTCKIRVQGLQSLVEVASVQSCILMLWHNRLMLMPYFGNRFAAQFSYTAAVSSSLDGEILVAVARSYPNGDAIRISRRAPFPGLRSMVSRLKESPSILVYTPDGPRGPRYHVKSGIVLAATNAEAPILPFTWQASSYWEFKTWDGLRLPKPFSTIDFKIGKPVPFAVDAAAGQDPTYKSTAARLLQQSLCALEAEVAGQILPEEPGDLTKN